MCAHRTAIVGLWVFALVAVRSWCRRRFRHNRSGRCNRCNRAFRRFRQKNPSARPGNGRSRIPFLPPVPNLFFPPHPLKIQSLPTFFRATHRPFRSLIHQYSLISRTMSPTLPDTQSPVRRLNHFTSLLGLMATACVVACAAAGDFRVGIKSAAASKRASLPPR